MTSVQFLKHNIIEKNLSQVLVWVALASNDHAAYEQHSYAACYKHVQCTCMYTWSSYLSHHDCVVYSSLSLAVSDRMVPLSVCWSLLQAKGKMVGDDILQPCLIGTASQDVHLYTFS